MRIRSLTFGLTRGRWRIELGRSFEYWDRYIVGPIYVLRHVYREYDA